VDPQKRDATVAGHDQLPPRKALSSAAQRRMENTSNPAKAQPLAFSV
jgi:hypothetical protein